MTRYSTRLRVAFDGRALTSPAGGVRRYVRELIEAFCIDAEVDVTMIGAASEASLPGRAARANAGVSLPTNLGWSLVGLPMAARRVPYDVFHAPAYTAPLWGVHPIVVTIHDVSYARQPQWYPYRVDPARRAFYAASARKANRVLTDSTFSRDEIVAAFNIDPSRIDVVPLGVSRRFAPAPDIQREPFVLHVGDLHPRRNVAMLLEVVLALRELAEGCRQLRLVLAGTDRGLLAALKAQSARAPDALDYVGQPTDALLVDLYRRAAVFAYPSRYEGFGLPVLEAMACGTPVVASAAAAIPEVAGDGAILLDADDAIGWHEALRALLTDPRLSAEWSRRGVARAAAFDWSRTALATIASYRRAVNGR